MLYIYSMFVGDFSMQGSRIVHFQAKNGTNVANEVFL